MSRHKLPSWFLIPAFAAALLAGCSKGSAEKKEAPESENVVTVDVAPVLHQPIQLKIRADAVIYPLQQEAIAPKISAPVKKFYVERGARVHAGQLLAEMENSDLAAAVAKTKAAYEGAEATYQTATKSTVPEEIAKAQIDVRSAKTDVDAAQRILEGRQALYKEGGIAQKDVNDAQVNLTQAQHKYDQAQQHLTSLQGVSRDQDKAAAAQRDAAKADYEAAQVQLGYSRISSHIDGVVTDRPIYAGEMAQNGGPIITIMDLSQVTARAHVSQEESAKVKLGDAGLVFPVEGGAGIPGKVTAISPALDAASTTVEVWVQADNSAGRLKPGASVRVEMIAASVPDALVIPEMAVLTRPSGNTTVIVVTPDNRPLRKPVHLGIRDAGNVQVVEGLQNGERVVTTGVFELDKLDDDVYAKTKVEIAPPKEEEEEK